MFKRIFFFLLTNAAVMLTFSITANLLGISSITGASTGALLVLSAVVGFSGSIISLALSKWMAKKSAGVRLIETPANRTEQWLVDTVKRQAQQAGIEMPEVGIFPGQQPNAFATGMTRNSSLVAVNTALLEQMQRNEVEAVLGHEVAHIANGDMVTMTLLQGVLNTFVFFFSRIIAGMLNSRQGGERQHSGGFAYYAAVMVSELVLGLFANMIAAWYSRQREFRADEGGALYSSKANMIAALEALGRPLEREELPETLSAFGINGAMAKFGSLFATHPPIEKRIAHLRSMDL